MKVLHVVAAMAIFSTSLTFAIAQVGSGTPDPDVKTALMRMEQEGTDALLKGDTSIMQRDIADSAVFTGPEGVTSGKADLIASVKNGDLKFQSSVTSDMKVMQYGDTAVVTSTSNDKGSFKGQDFSGTFRWTDVWVRKGGKWQMVASQGTPVMGAAKASS